MSYEEMLQNIIKALQQAIADQPEDNSEDEPKGSFEGYLKDTGFTSINKEE